MSKFDGKRSQFKDYDFTPFELLGIITHIKNEIEVDLLRLSNHENRYMKTKHEIENLLNELLDKYKNMPNKFELGGTILFSKIEVLKWCLKEDNDII